MRTIAQTLRLGRYDPAIRFSVGQSLFLSGYADEAVVQWNAAFHANRSIRKRICDALAPRFSAQALLTNFNPQLTELEDIFAAYVRLQSDADILRLIDVIIEHTREVAAADFSKLQSSEKSDDDATDEPDDSPAAESVAASDSEGQLHQVPQLLLQVAAAAGRLQLPDRQELLLRRAATLAPEAEAPRRALGLLLMEQEAYDEAERLFAACQDLNPGDTKLDDLRGECRRLELVKKRRLRSVSNQL
jgi:tetratricopeptide (TPR) repeat protein